MYTRKKLFFFSSSGMYMNWSIPAGIQLPHSCGAAERCISLARKYPLIHAVLLLYYPQGAIQFVARPAPDCQEADSYALLLDHCSISSSYPTRLSSLLSTRRRQLSCKLNDCITDGILMCKYTLDMCNATPRRY